MRDEDLRRLCLESQQSNKSVSMITFCKACCVVIQRAETRALLNSLSFLGA